MGTKQSLNGRTLLKSVVRHIGTQICDINEKCLVICVYNPSRKIIMNDFV